MNTPGPFRVITPKTKTAGFQDTDLPSQTVVNWADRLIKLIPSEILAAYVSGRALAPEYEQYWAPVCLALLLIVRAIGTKAPNSSTQWGAVAIAAISFLIWVYSIGGFFFSLKINDAAIPALAMIAWTVIAPILYKGNEEEE